MVGRVGLEPTTNGLKGRCSTTELPTLPMGRVKLNNASDWRKADFPATPSASGRLARNWLARHGKDENICVARGLRCGLPWQELPRAWRHRPQPRGHNRNGEQTAHPDSGR